MSHPLTWAQRHSQLEKLIASPRVVQVRDEALKAASLIPQTDDNAASAVSSHQVSLGLAGKAGREEYLGRQLDASLSVLWSAPSSSTRDANDQRFAAQPLLKSLLTVALSESSKDLTSISCLESNREGTVELVRCRMDRKIYVLKSTTKGAAKRGYRSNAPVTERRLLSLSRQCREADKGNAIFTPACIAAFQSPRSLHILMDYCPAGDLYHFLESAGEAPVTNEARNKTGGLLSEGYVRRYAIDMVAAIAWIHEQGFMHRDIKPGNWLFDKTGHLILCDLASAAPFARFDHVPGSANLPEWDESRSSKTSQRRVLYRHCCLIGTADYIAPEIFWSADLMSRRRERRLYREEEQSGASSQSSKCSIEEDDGSEEDDDEPPPDGPGLYGPECDWWSLGVVLFEMVFKRMPFFSEKVAETMEMIKNHESHFRLDSWVQCSPRLTSLIKGLVCHSEKRLGYTSSMEVKGHLLFKGVDWNRPWDGEPVPFVPNLETGSHSKSIGEASFLQPEPSVLHSPRFKNDYNDSTHLSHIWSGDPHDFPAFPNSVDLSRSAAAAGQILEEEEEEEEEDSEATITNSSPSTRKALQQQTNSAVLRAEQLWSNFDPTWIGFSFVPPDTAFTPAVEGKQALLDGLPSPISSPGNATDISNILYSPQAASTGLPMVSTPCQSREIEREEMQSTLPPLQSTPFHPSVAHNLHRRAVETASRVRSETVEHEIQQSFATPLRKTSMPNLASQGDRQQMMSNLQTPANVGSWKGNVPPSPYPFPVATIARPRKTPGGPPRLPSSGLRRADLERARSTSAGTGEGSDSRCSGGSNIKRDISEREAWRELKVAVMQSARKGRRDFVKELEEKQTKRPTLIHAATTGAIPPATGVDSRRSNARVTEGEEKGQRRSSATFGLGALGGALKGRRPNLTRFLSHHGEIRGGKPVPLKPVVSMTSPDRPASLISSASSTSSPPQPPQGQDGEGVQQSAKSRLVLPGFWNKHGEGGNKLAKKRSARQLLLKAQDRETPTKLASRSGSPLLASFENLSLGAKSSTHVDDEPLSSPRPDFRPELQHQQHGRTKGKMEACVHAKAMISLDSDDSTSSSHACTRSNEVDQRLLSSPPQSASIVQLRREESTGTQTMRRRDSREMLSQYRQGINPDETAEDGEVGQRRARKVMSIHVLQPSTTSNQPVGPTTSGDGSSLSSPSLPSFPDAFGGGNGLDSKKSNHSLRRASMFPLRSGSERNDAEAVAASHGPPFRSLNSRASNRALGKRNSSGKLSILGSGFVKATVPPYPRQSSATAATARDESGRGRAEEGEGNGSLGEVSMMSGLDWRYESMRENLSQVEARLQRIKARLRED